MSALLIIVILIGALGFLPVLVYLMVKFGAAAYFREKQKQNRNKEKT